MTREVKEASLRKEENRKEQQVKCNCDGNEDLKYPHEAPTIVRSKIRIAAADLKGAGRETLQIVFAWSVPSG